mmetsp:Transcript_45019/g.143369  ORF Transcript_45019/g.143369 Transcript_45019/m.143369 type:complete len:131 (+) Transcript_45019:534-926(+)
MNVKKLWSVSTVFLSGVLSDGGMYICAVAPRATRGTDTCLLARMQLAMKGDRCLPNACARGRTAPVGAPRDAGVVHGIGAKAEIIAALNGGTMPVRPGHPGPFFDDSEFESEFSDHSRCRRGARERGLWK